MSRETLAVLLLVALATGCGSPATVAEVRGAPTPSLEASAAQPPAHPTQVQPIPILRDWDARRASAWARGDPRVLRSLYTAGSAAGRRDVAMLRAWAARGLTVRGLHTQLLAVRVVAHTGSAWTIDVTDRVVGGVAVGRGVRRPLPRDQATTRTLRLRLVDGEWRVSAVRSVGG